MEDGRSKHVFCKRANQYSEFIILIIESLRNYGRSRNPDSGSAPYLDIK
ncbi:hypothetical protein GPL10_14740 [Bacteroides fragilis]|nr:hypothetical protein [Bacteroides fragilis]RDT72767.1 hypothetical protein DWS34_22460 [Bacteroides fragilis]RHD46079.1 hypothetical protein DW791_20295 [Bacteroides fragilis]